MESVKFFAIEGCNERFFGSVCPLPSPDPIEARVAVDGVRIDVIDHETEPSGRFRRYVGQEFTGGGNEENPIDLAGIYIRAGRWNSAAFPRF